MALQPGGGAADTFDYVIVGSGAVGSVLSARLTEGPGTTVCVLECGLCTGVWAAGPASRGAWKCAPTRALRQILLYGTRAIGVRYVDDRDRTASRMVNARRELIVSCGTANTAKLLQITGGGPAWLLQSLGVGVRADLPVGENPRDH